MKYSAFVMLYTCVISTAQIQFNFSDSSQIHSWISSTENLWEISANPFDSQDFSLHHFFDNSVSSSDYISTSLNKLKFAQNSLAFEFDILYQYNPSSTNCWQVWLGASDNAQGIRSNQINGYVFGVNFTGYDDTLRLWKCQNQEKTVVVSTNINWQEDVGTATWCRFKIEKESSGIWNIGYSTDETDYQSIGQGIENDFLYLNNFILAYHYTSSQDRKLWFDNLKISGSHYLDTVAPKIDRYEFIDPQTIRLITNEPIDTNSLNEVNILLENFYPKYKIISDQEVEVDLGVHNINPVAGNLIISGLIDLEGNVGRDSIAVFKYYQQPGDIVINELMYDPSPVVDLPEYEYIELFNNSAYSISLEGWLIQCGSVTKQLSPLLLPPDEFVIICHHEATGLFDTTITVHGILTSQSTLPNSGGTVRLKDNTGLLIDSLFYQPGTLVNAGKSGGGWSIEKTNPEGLCTTKGKWTFSQNPAGGTPGYVNSVFSSQPDTVPVIIYDHSLSGYNNLKIQVNKPFIADSINIKINYTDTIFGEFINDTMLNISLNTSLKDGFNNILITGLYDQCMHKTDTSIRFNYSQVKPGDIVINEIMADPYPPVDLPESEYIEIMNNSSTPLQLNELSLSISGSKVSMPVRTILPDEYVVICDTSGLIAPAEWNIVPVKSFPTIKNDNGTILLLSVFKGTIDSVAYKSTWYNDISKSEGGYSLEKTNPEGLCTKNGIWTASIDPTGGTPGRPNSVLNMHEDAESPELIQYEQSGPSQLSIILDEDIIIDSIYVIANLYDTLIPHYSAPNTYRFTSEKALPEGTNHFFVENAMDICQNKENFTIKIPYVTIKPYEVIISEILSDPTPSIGLPETEYIEIFNRTNRPLFLSELTLKTNDNSYKLPERVLKPKQYYVLCDTTKFKTENKSVLIHCSGMPSLGNYESELLITNNEDESIYYVHYQVDWHSSDEKKAGGWSLEIIDTDNRCGQQNNWISSVDSLGGTPGWENSVNTKNPDLQSPVLQTVFPIDANEIEIGFNEPVNPNSLTFNSFSIDNEIFITTANKLGMNNQNFNLVLNDDLDPETLYKLINENMVEDCARNMLETSEWTFMLPSPPDSNGIRINEILFNASDDNQEFIELINTGTLAYNLAEISIKTYKNDLIDNEYIISDANRLLLPGQIVLLSKDPDKTLTYYDVSDTVEQLSMERFPSLNNSEGIVSIYSGDTLIDKLEYNEDMHHALITDRVNVSIERIDSKSPSQNLNNWMSASKSVGYATPGYKNSHTPVQSDTKSTAPVIQIIPEVFSPDNDGYNDISEIHLENLTAGSIVNIQIFNSNGILVRQLAKNYLTGNDDIIFWDGQDDIGRMCNIGIYIIIIQVFDERGQVSEHKLTTVLAVKRTN